MPPSYGTKLRESLVDMSSYKLGTDLARVCVAAKLPSRYLAHALGVSRQTIHTWFLGGVIRRSKHYMIEVLIKMIEEDTAAGKLPAATMSEARAYLTELTGKTIKVGTDKR